MEGGRVSKEVLRRGGRSDVGELVMVANSALVGVPAAYAVSRSLPVTALAVVLAIVLVAGLVWRGRRNA